MQRPIVKLTTLTYISEKTAYSHTFQPTKASHNPKLNPQMLSMLAKTANHLTAISLNFPFQKMPIRRLDAQHQTVSNESHCGGSSEIAVFTSIGAKYECRSSDKKYDAAGRC